MKQAIICDLDGTLFDITERLKFIQGETKDWKSFSDPKKIAELDEVNEWCALLLDGFYCKKHRECDDIEIIFVSGRMKKKGVEFITWESIRRAVGTEDFQLHMRDDKDYRDDTVIKKELYEQHIKGKYNVLFVIDDRKKVVDMWRNEGLVVLHCAEGNF